MKANRIRHYVSKKGNVTFVYVVNGKDNEIESYRDAQGANYREFEDESNPSNPLNGKPLWFTTRALAPEVELEITTNGNVVLKESTEEVAAKVLDEEQLIAARIAELKAQDRFNRSKVSK
jgi:hypothetical protein